MRYGLARVALAVMWIGLSPLAAQVGEEPGWPVPLGVLTAFSAPYVAQLDPSLPDKVVFVPSGQQGILAFTAAGDPLPGWTFQGGQLFGIQEFIRVGDIHGDGTSDVVYKPTSNGNFLEAVDQTGTLLPGFPLWVYGEFGSRFDNLLLADLVPGGGLEIVLAADNIGVGDAWVVVLDASGSPLPGWPKSFVVDHLTIAADDLNGDGLDDLVVATRDDCDCGDSPVYVYDGNGVAFPGWPASPVGGFFEDAMWNPVISDLDGDGQKEIIGSTLHRVFAMSLDGSMFRPAFVSTFNAGQVAVADLDGDGRKEIVAGGSYLKVIDIDQGVISTNAGGAYFGFYPPSIADVDGDGMSEIAALSVGPTSFLHLYDMDLVDRPGFPFGVGSTQGFIQVNLVDLEGDGDLELIHYHSLDIHAYDIPNTGPGSRWVQWGYHNGQHGKSASSASTGAPFVRGDVDGGGSRNLADAITILGHLFVGNVPPIVCRDAADIDDSGDLDLADPILLLQQLFVPGSGVVDPPCAVDSTADALECAGGIWCVD